MKHHGCTKSNSFRYNFFNLNLPSILFLPTHDEIKLIRILTRKSVSFGVVKLQVANGYIHLLFVPLRFLLASCCLCVFIVDDSLELPLSRFFKTFPFVVIVVLVTFVISCVVAITVEAKKCNLLNKTKRIMFSYHLVV